LDFKLLSKYRIRYPKSEFANSPKKAALAALKLGFPVAMKIASKNVLHKTDKGGVILDIKSRQDVQNAYKRLMKSFPKKESKVLVQKMAGKGAVELIIGGKKDPHFGQMIMLGMGGIFVEVFKDVTFRVCPIDERDAMEMISELKVYPILAGARGRKPVNRKELVSTLLKVSKLLQKEDPKEFDLNPLMADEKGCIAVDMRILR